MKAIVNLIVIRRIREDTNIAEVDWCGFIHSCLKQSAVPNTLTGFYIGPLTFLILLYLDSTKFERFPIRIAWTWCESELHETEGFYEVGDNVSRTRSSLNSPTDKQSVCSLIEEKLKFICDEKAELEDILRKANTQFSN
ncbi:hypothetical protein Tco_0130004, partial [Tanacetum coccineum]